MNQKRVVSFRLCPPSDEQNTIEEEPQQPQQPQQSQQPQRPAVMPFYRPFRPSVPTFDSSVFGE